MASSAADGRRSHAVAAEVRRGGFLVAGIGSIGRRHVDNLRMLGEAQLSLFRTGSGSVGVPDAYDLPVHRDLDAALAEAPDAVVVTNPTALHVPLALRAARAGCHLFIEKPLSSSMEGVAELQAAVHARRLLVVVGFQFRFHPGLQRVKEWIEAGAVGPVVSAHAHWGEHLSGWHPWEDYRRSYSARRALGGGALLTLCHPFDYLRWLLGDVVSVSAETGQLGGLGIDVEDTAQVTLRFESGALAGVYLDYVERPPAHWLRVLGRSGRITWDNGHGRAFLHDASGALRDVFVPAPGFDRNRLFLDEMRHFLRCLREGERPRCGLDDGVRALQIALAASRAAEEGRRVRP